MKRLIIYSILSIVAIYSYGQNSFNKTDIKSIMKSVADWQIANPAKGNEHDDLNWTYAALYMGMIDWAELTEKEDKDSSYYEWLMKIGRRNAWQVGKYMYHADHIAVGQVFLDMYQKYHDRNMWLPTLARTEFVINHPSASTLELDYRNMASLERWSWCDALFMAPPVYAKMYMLTDDWKYIEFMNREYKATYDYLFDKEEKLFYRDHRYFNQKEANGTKVFWGRGNGWVLGGLCEILQTLPRNNMHRQFYQDLFITLSDRIIQLQGKDGYCGRAGGEEVRHPALQRPGRERAGYDVADHHEPGHPPPHQGHARGCGAHCLFLRPAPGGRPPGPQEPHRGL